MSLDLARPAPHSTRRQIAAVGQASIDTAGCQLLHAAGAGQEQCMIAPLMISRCRRWLDKLLPRFVVKTRSGEPPASRI